MSKRSVPPVNKAYRRSVLHSVIRVQGQSVALEDAETAKAVLEYAKAMPEDSTIYDLYIETRDKGIHSGEPWEWGLSEGNVTYFEAEREGRFLA
ncbi:MAG: hypothetical protein EOM02_10955 [Synergistales bacterium]|nr:hypothetical protein [Synergistales bacterium]